MFLYCNRRIAVVNVFVDQVCVAVDALVIVALRERNKERIPDEGADDSLRVGFIPPVIKFGNFFFYLSEQFNRDLINFNCYHLASHSISRCIINNYEKSWPVSHFF